MFLQPLFASSYYTSTLSHPSFWIPYRILKTLQQQVIKNSLKILLIVSFQTNRQETESEILASFDPEREEHIILCLSPVETVVHTELPN